jgi:hypothetical protein
MHPGKREIDHLIEDAKKRQRNIVFPDTVRNARSIDAYFWRGSPDAPLVQRVAAWLIGLTFVGGGFCLIEAIRSREEESGAFLTNLVALLVIAVGAKTFYNGCKRRKKPRG